MHNDLADRSGELILKEFNDTIDAWLDHGIDWSGLPANLAEAGRYSVLSGGKRLRPALVLMSCSCAGGRVEQALPAAGALELVHCFSLIHDDLPALDNDLLRRNRPTLHVHSGEAMAILAGDLTLTMAFAELAKADLPAEKRIALVDELARSTTDMVAGQVYDTLGGLPEERSAIEQVQLVHQNKTGALIRCACRMGAICGNADTDTMRALTNYGDAIGLMFQIVDDLIDVTQSAEHVGKATGKDADLGKLTYPQVLGIDACHEQVKRLLQEAIEALSPLGDAAEDLAVLAKFMAIRTR